VHGGYEAGALQVDILSARLARACTSSSMERVWQAVRREHEPDINVGRTHDLLILDGMRSGTVYLSVSPNGPG